MGDAGPSQSPTSSTPLYAQPTKNWVIPPRPKPGRKPKKETEKPDDDSNAEEIRKNQNRASQRAFRERRQDQLATLQARIQQYEQGETERFVHIQTLSQRLKDENDQLKQENASLKEELMRLKGESTPEASSKNEEPSETESLLGGRKRNPSTEGEEDTATNKRSRSTRRPSLYEQPHAPRIGQASSGFSPPPPAITTSQTIPVTSTYITAITSPESSTRLHRPSLSSGSRLPSLPDASPSRPGQDIVITNCGFCADGTPCICREISRQGAVQEDLQSISRTFGTSASEASTRPSDSLLDNLPPYQPAVPLRKRPVRVYGATPVSPFVFPLNQATSTANASSTTGWERDAVVQCSGDPSNCPACRNDTFGQAFCSALSAACASGRCGCAGRRNAQTSRHEAAPSRETHSSTVPRASAWAALKSHPAIQQHSFTNLDMLAEVVIRGGEADGGSQGEKTRKDGDTTMKDCGNPFIEVPMEGVRGALAILDRHIEKSGD